jgi:hypothetical protein
MGRIVQPVGVERGDPVDDFAGRGPSPHNHTLETVRYAVLGALIAVAIYGLFAKDTENVVPSQVIAALVGFAVALALRVRRVI